MFILLQYPNEVGYVGGRIRTCEGTKPMDLKSIPFDRSGTPTVEMELLYDF